MVARGTTRSISKPLHPSRSRAILPMLWWLPEDKPIQRHAAVLRDGDYVLKRRVNATELVSADFILQDAERFAEFDLSALASHFSQAFRHIFPVH